MMLANQIVDRKVLSKSIRGLVMHTMGKENEKDTVEATKNRPLTFLDSETDLQLFLIINVKRNITSKNGALPIPLPLPHSQPKKTCLFSKDGLSSTYTSLAPPNLTIISIEKLRKEYKPFEAKRQLIASFELFLADRRILRMLPPLLGKSFFEKKRLPIPVKLPQSPDKVSFLKIIEEASRTTPLYFPSNGRCISIKVATLDMPLEEIEANILTVLSHAIKQIPGGSLNNVQSVHIKSTSSTALPLYSIST